MTAKDVDEAVANSNAYTSYAVGYCLQWVRERCWEVGSFYASAIDAWNGAAKKHPGDRNPPKGAPMFYRGGSYGHIVISHGGGNMRSTDCQSSGHVSNAALNWPENAWGDDYLGWTEDLNGVDLPLGLDDDNDDGGDDMPQYDHASTGSVSQKIKANEWVAIVWKNVPSGKAFTEGKNTAKLGGRTYTASVHANFDAPAGSTIRIRAVEVSDGETNESNPQTEFTATSGTSYASHDQIGHVADGRSWAVRVSCSQDATLTAADVTVLSW